jgi:hypothetical protein
LLAAWAAEHCSIVVDQYRGTRFPDWTAFESYDFARDIVEWNDYGLEQFLTCLPSDALVNAKRALAVARRVAYKTHAIAETNS